MVSKEKKLCVIIPVHQAALSIDDIISLQAKNKHLSKHDSFLIYPVGMDVSNYLSIASDLILKPVKVEWLSSIENYNRMKTDLTFYQMFSNYNYMMTYELDAYIFSSDLNKYKVFDFDYIGAPLFEGYLQAMPGAPYTRGLNSGFSVRNIQSCLKVFEKLKHYKLPWIFYKYVIAKMPRRIHNTFVSKINKLTEKRFEMVLNGQLSFWFEKNAIWEDIVWSVIVPSLFPFFKTADQLTAGSFSIEALPERLFEINNNHLPLGCHGWPKKKEFWKNYINII